MDGENVVSDPKCLGPVPSHLLKFDWYLPHQAWLKSIGECHHDYGDVSSTRANLARANLARANLAGANLTRANLARAYLTDANLTDANLTRANLDGAYLAGANLTDANLDGAYLTDANLTDANLTDANLTRAYLTDANLTDANLTDANLTRAEEIPVIEDIHKKVYESASQPDALYMGCWHHDCGTTHCRAGWVVTLAGEAGKKLEKQIGTAAAANLIYLKSDPGIERMPDYFCSNEEALEDMKRLAGV